MEPALSAMDPDEWPQTIHPTRLSMQATMLPLTPCPAGTAVVSICTEPQRALSLLTRQENLAAIPIKVPLIDAAIITVVGGDVYVLIREFCS